MRTGTATGPFKEGRGTRWVADQVREHQRCFRGMRDQQRAVLCLPPLCLPVYV